MFPSQFKCCRSHLDSASFSVLLLGENVHGKYSKMYWHMLFSFQEKESVSFYCIRIGKRSYSIHFKK